MTCPQCQSTETDPSGNCLVCGRQSAVQPPAAGQEAVQQKPAGGQPEAAGNADDLPPWRQELSQRLQEIKQKKEAQAASRPELRSAAAPAKPAESQAALQARLLEKAPPRKPQPRPAAPLPRQKTLQPIQPEPQAATAERRDIRSVIDQAVSRQVPGAALSGVSKIYEPLPLREEGKLILLSRTLSGLVDLIVMVLCGGAFVIAADYFSGIVSLDKVSLANFAALLLLIYFLYSLFFLAASNQTIGMMITELRVVAPGDRRPALGQIFRRCILFLPSLLALGIGLLLSLFDRESRCFHDRLSNTRVVRL